MISPSLALLAFLPFSLPSTSSLGVPVETTVSVCLPSDCTSVRDLDWGPWSAVPSTLHVPKFDASLGTLLEVELTLDVRLVANGCLDNQSGWIMPAAYSLGLTAIVTPLATNSPQVTGLGQLPSSEVVVLTPQGFILGSSDGMDDCATPGVTFGNPSMGDGTPGEDHRVYAFDGYFPPKAASVSGADLAPWVGAPGETVDFESTALVSITGTIHPQLVQVHDPDASLRLSATYRYIPPVQVGTAYCFCASGSPCGNVGAPDEGCANSTGAGGVLEAFGSASLAAADFKLRGRQLAPGRPALFFQGVNATNGGQGALFGDGLRCADSQVVRLEVSAAGDQGELETTVDVAARGGVAPGDLRRYQLWYRDPLGSPCGHAFNLTNGLELTWRP